VKRFADEMLAAGVPLLVRWPDYAVFPAYRVGDTLVWQINGEAPVERPISDDAEWAEIRVEM
jgi:hypothetical protein